jgi:hypothetical protein
VVVHREALRLGLRGFRETLRAGSVEVSPADGADVAGDAVAAPAEVVGCGDVGEDVEALDVSQVLTGLDEPRGIDD